MQSNYEPTGEEVALSVLCHIVSLVATSILCNLVVPIVIMLISDSPFVKAHAKEALNFQITVMLWALISVGLCFVFVGIPMLILLGILALVLPIIATCVAASGKPYRYPLTFRLIK